MNRKSKNTWRGVKLRLLLNVQRRKVLFFKISSKSSSIRKSYEKELGRKSKIRTSLITGWQIKNNYAWRKLREKDTKDIHMKVQGAGSINGARMIIRKGDS